MLNSYGEYNQAQEHFSKASVRWESPRLNSSFAKNMYEMARRKWDEAHARYNQARKAYDKQCG